MDIFKLMSRCWICGVLLFSSLSLVCVAVAEETPKKAEVRFSKVSQRSPAPLRKPLTPAQLNEFLAEPRNAILATINKDGSPQLTPVSFFWDGTAFYVTTTKETVKYQNVKRDPRITITVDQGDDYRTVIAEGKAQIQAEDIWPTTGKILENYFGPQAGATYLEAMKKQNRVLIVLKAETDVHLGTSGCRVRSVAHQAGAMMSNTLIRPPVSEADGYASKACIKALS